MNAFLSKPSVRATGAKLLLFAVLAPMNGMTNMTVTAGIAAPETFGSNGQGMIVLVCAALVVGLVGFLPRRDGMSLFDTLQYASPVRGDWLNALWAVPFLFHRFGGSTYTAGHLRVDVWSGWGGELTMPAAACAAAAFVTLSYFLRVHAQMQAAAVATAVAKAVAEAAKAGETEVTWLDTEAWRRADAEAKLHEFQDPSASQSPNPGL